GTLDYFVLLDGLPPSGGAAVQNLSHSASFESCDKNAPSKSGTKQPPPSTLMLLERAVPPHQVLSSSEFALAVGFARFGGGSDGSWRGALGITQRQIPARVAGEGKLGRRLPSELRVWSYVVVIGLPASERDASLGQRREQRLVQQLIPQPTVEALDEGILHGLARRDVVPGDTALIGPCQDGVAGQLAAVVADHHLRLAALDHKPLHF